MLGRFWLVMLVLSCASLAPGLVSAQDSSLRLVLLPPSGSAQAAQAMEQAQRVFEARVSATGRFRFLGDRETETLFERAREATGVSPEAQREADLAAARRTYADWAVGFRVEGRDGAEVMVTVDVWNPTANERIHTDTEVVTGAPNLAAATRQAADALARRFLVSAPVRALEGQASTGPGRLDVVDVRPVPLRVFVNDREVGQAPGQFSGLPAGTVQIELRAPGHQSELRVIELRADEVVRIEGVRLSAQPLEVEVRVQVAGARILVDGQAVAVSEAGRFLQLSLPPSSEVLRIEREGYRPFTTRLRGGAGGARRFDVTLDTAAGPDGVSVQTAVCDHVHPQDGLRMCLVPAASVVIGSDLPSAPPEARPARPVTLTRNLLVHATEVTVAAYRRCVDAGACAAPGLEIRGSTDDTARSHSLHAACNFGAAGRDDHPMNCVNWHGAQAYCRWIGGSLLTEAEWEHAARGTAARSYPWTAEEVPDGALTCQWAKSALCAGSTTTGAVGERPSGRSPYGLHDMAGNVSEWVLDTWEASAYASWASVDPSVEGTASARRVVRGGSYRDFPPLLYTFFRARLPAAARPEHVGFRCAVVSP